MTGRVPGSGAVSHPSGRSELTTRGEPTLASATVRFLSLDDGKERNSIVTVTVRDATNAVVAFIDNIFDEFKPRRLYGPYDMQVVNAVDKSLVRPGGSVTVYFLQTSNAEF